MRLVESYFPIAWQSIWVSCSRMCHQVLPDWNNKKGVPLSAGTSLETELQHEQLELKLFMATLSEADRLRVPEWQRASRAKQSTKYVPNQFYVQALEHSLSCGLGITLEKFVVTDPPKPLSPSEVRYYTSSAALYPKGAPAYMAETRACVEDRITKRRRIEVPDFVLSQGMLPERPALHLCLDKGSVGFYGVQWMLQKLDIR
eukprot:853390-Amphidinium_carterae.2